MSLLVIISITLLLYFTLLKNVNAKDYTFSVDETSYGNGIFKLDVYYQSVESLITSVVDSLIISKDDNIYEIFDQLCSKYDIDDSNCLPVLNHCKKHYHDLYGADKKHVFAIVSYPYLETVGGIVVSHYLIDRLNYYFSSTDGKPIAFHMPITYDSDSKLLELKSDISNYNTPKLTRLQFIDDENLITIYPEIIPGNYYNKRILIRWILYFLRLENKTIEDEYQYNSNDYIACYSEGICNQFDSTWHRYPLRVIDLNWNMFRTIDNSRIRDIDVVYFKPGTRKSLWFDNRGNNINLDYKNYEYMLKHSYALMNKTLILMNTKLKQQDRLDLLSRAKYFISLDPATFRSVEAAMVGCISIVYPVPGVSKTEWASVSYAPEYLRYGIAYGFEDIDHAKNTMDMVLPNLREQDNRTKDILSSFIKDVKQHFNLDPDFLKEKLL